MNRWQPELSGRSKRPVMAKNSRHTATRPLMDALTKASRSNHDHQSILGHWLTASNLLFSQLLERITPAQRPVLCAFLREPNDHYVARELGLRESTVRNHMSLLETKLNAQSRQHLVAMCMAALIREALSPSQTD